jgi:hypothetical protein
MLLVTYTYLADVIVGFMTPTVDVGICLCERERQKWILSLNLMVLAKMTMRVLKILDGLQSLKRTKITVKMLSS